MSDLSDPSSVIVTPLSKHNVLRAFRVAREVFPNEKLMTGLSFAACLLPGKLWSYGSNVSALDYYVAEKDGKVVGITGLYAINGYNNEAWIGWLGVAPGEREKGNGSRLLSETIAEARRRGLDTLRLWTSDNPEFSRSNAMYESRGFVKEYLNTMSPEDSTPIYRAKIYTLPLKGQTAEPWRGSIEDALIGANPARLQRAKRAFMESQAPTC